MSADAAQVRRMILRRVGTLVFAGCVPGRRALRTDPMQALRYE